MLRGRLRTAAILAGAWMLLAVLAATQNGLGRLYDAAPPRWGELFALSLADYGTCAVFTPVFVLLLDRRPIAREGWPLTLGIYAAILSAAVVIKYAVFVPIRQAIHPALGYTFGRVLATGFVYELMIFVAVVGVLYALRAASAIRERELRSAELQTELSRAQLEALKSQIEPHFLFNTLNAIATLMHRDVDAAEAMLIGLADLLRLTLDHNGTQEVPLADELALLDRYVQILRIRFGDRLTVAFDVPEEALAARVPYFILQPLVENAVKHGIAVDGGAGRVCIAVRLRGEALEITVSDDGPGLPAPSTEAVREGIGLSNTRARLFRLYGKGAALAMRRGEPRGTDVTLTLPRAS